MEFETPVNGCAAFPEDQLLLDHLKALAEEVRYRIGEVRRAIERLDKAERHLVTILQQTEEPPF